MAVREKQREALLLPTVGDQIDVPVAADVCRGDRMRMRVRVDVYLSCGEAAAAFIVQDGEIAGCMIRHRQIDAPVAVEVSGDHLRRICATARLLRDWAQSSLPVTGEDKKLLAGSAEGDVGTAIAVEIGSGESLRMKSAGKREVNGCRVAGKAAGACAAVQHAQGEQGEKLNICETEAASRMSMCRISRRSSGAIVPPRRCPTSGVSP